MSLRNIAFNFRSKGPPPGVPELNIGYSVSEELRARAVTMVLNAELMIVNCLLSLSVKAPFDGPILRNQPAQETILDYIFSTLGIDGQ